MEKHAYIVEREEDAGADTLSVGQGRYGVAQPGQGGSGHSEAGGRNHLQGGGSRVHRLVRTVPPDGRRNFKDNNP
jgi:hypothetical protein